MQIEVPIGSTARAIFETLAFENGNRVAPDSAPTVDNCFVNGVAASLTATIAQLQDETPANITGVYQVSFATGTPNNLAVRDDVWVEVIATINGSQARKLFQFKMVPAETSVTPVIR